MNKMALSSNLQQLMRIHGNLSISDLARSTSIPQPTLHHILSGATKNPRKKALKAISDFFSISIDQLNGDNPLPNIIPATIKEDLKLNTIPVIPWDLLKNWPPENFRALHLKEILLDKKIANNSFALIVPDSSMEPTFPKNALLIFDLGKSPMDRDFVIIHSCDDNILFNRLFTDNNENYIKQNLEDGNVKLVKLDGNHDRIMGTLIEVRIQY